MKKLFLAFTLLAIGTAPALAQVINNTNNTSPLNGGIANMMGNNQNKVQTTTMPISQTQGVHIKSLEERRQDAIMKQQQQAQKSGIGIRNIPQQNPGVTNFQPGAMQSGVQSNVPTQQLQNNSAQHNSSSTSSPTTMQGYQ
jgi:hypothetical protein